MNDPVYEIEVFLRDVYQYDLKVLGLHSYDKDLDVEVFNTPFDLRLPVKFRFSGTVQLLCVCEFFFLILTFSSSGLLMDKASGFLDAELVLVRFGYEMPIGGMYE
ncbi:hypothetical protein LRP49_23370 [Enterovibrio sp. ZSDZ35]|uniref:Uncharacterized protein n=1 Tax=Enterovibrio qingdaonensis TaxID=2899818 RepID=A0ABT5QT09_9GAMM|nr:hypothetical protein [Enterovibrio sp. ZSDZ35]MDD1784119.1 hypothetical protein [Enterovibrio sp. ZSDZ35]